ncbi:MAG: SRPBCC family protein [Actinomycetota bacterium]
MKIAGSYEIASPQSQVWKAMQDPAVLARTLPGCESLTVTGADQYAATITAGVASIKGTYQGRVRLTDQVEPERFTLHAQGAGAPGTVQAEADVRLEDRGGATLVSYDADAVVGGTIGGVGQRMLTTVAKRTADDFFAAIERELTVGPAVPAETPVEAVPAETATTAGAEEQPAVGQVFQGARAPAAGDRRPVELLAAAVVGAVIALAGVLIGRRTVRGG